MRPAGALYVALIVVLVAGCSLLPIGSPGPGGTAAAEIAAHQQQWEVQGIRSYRWKVAYLCECPGGTFSVTVIDGAVTGVVDDSGAAIVDRALPLTIDALFAQAAQTIAGGGTVQAEWDAPSGLPRSMVLDPVPKAIDDELSMQLVAFEPTR